MKCFRELMKRYSLKSIIAKHLVAMAATVTPAKIISLLVLEDGAVAKIKDLKRTRFKLVFSLTT